ncbi:MAG: hypothetical protein A3K08_01640 [Candidatus Doudnabacteria bacterium RIFCSPLOWO2_01_41_7]|nr:MAG: hypothetical protein A3K08_01640 [Candidatus Doudnabacteria bacterium RIFCSPLOWO2_01_41_7]
MISLSLRSGISLQNVIDQLKGIRGPDPVFHNGERILSLPDAVANVLENHLKRGQQTLQLEIPQPVETPKLVQEPIFQAVTQEMNTGKLEFVKSKTSVADLGHAPVCMMCGNMLRMAEGCQKCESCGWSKC